MSVDRRSTRLTSKWSPQITLRTSNSRPLKCTKMQPCSGVHGAVGAWAGGRWEWGLAASGGFSGATLVKFHESPLNSTSLRSRNEITAKKIKKMKRNLIHNGLSLLVAT